MQDVRPGDFFLLNKGRRVAKAFQTARRWHWAGQGNNLFPGTARVLILTIAAGREIYRGYLTTPVHKG